MQTTTSFLQTFYFNCYTIHFRALDDITLPYYKGFALRGAFGHAFKKTVCIRKQTECHECLVRGQCPYSLLMGNPVLPEHPHSKKYYTPQRPYIILPPLTRANTFPRGEDFSFDLILIGKMNTFIPHFIYAFAQMGEGGLGRNRGKCSLTSIHAHSFSGESLCIYNHTTGALRLPEQSFHFSDFTTDPGQVDEITLRFATPFRVKINDKLASVISFSLFYDRLLERIMVLNHFFCNGDLVEHTTPDNPAPPEFEVTKKSLHWIDLERYSSKQQGKMKMGGVTGSITFRGPLGPYLPVLKAGEYIHAGKGTSFGFGKYRIETVGPP